MISKIVLLFVVFLFKADANSKLVLIGGISRDWNRFDSLEIIQDGEASCDDGIIKPLPHAVVSPIASMIKVNDQHRIMVCGGSDTDVYSDCYHYYDNEWHTVSPLGVAVNDAPSAVIGDKLYVFGGSRGMSSPLSRHVQVYNIKDDTWAVMPNVLKKNSLYACAISIDDKIVLISNYNENKIFDGETLRDFPSNVRRRGSAGCTLVDINGKKAIIAVGGLDMLASDNAEYLYWNSEDPTSSKWNMMQNDGVWKGRQSYPAIGQVQDKIVMAGGTRYWEDVEELNLDSNAEDVLSSAEWVLTKRYLIEIRILATSLVVPKELISNCQ